MGNENTKPMSIEKLFESLDENFNEEIQETQKNFDLEYLYITKQYEKENEDDEDEDDWLNIIKPSECNDKEYPEIECYNKIIILEKIFQEKLKKKITPKIIDYLSNIYLIIDNMNIEKFKEYILEIKSVLTLPHLIESLPNKDNLTYDQKLSLWLYNLKEIDEKTKQEYKYFLESNKDDISNSLGNLYAILRITK